MFAFLVVCGVGLGVALLFVLARRAPRRDLLRLPPGPVAANPVAPNPIAREASAKAMVDVTPRGTSIKV